MVPACQLGPLLGRGPLLIVGTWGCFCCKATDAYGEESREARALVEQYGSARSREEERGPVVRGGVLRRGRRVGNTYGRGSL